MEIKVKDGVDTPEQGYLGVVVGADGQLMAVPPGALLFIVDNPQDLSRNVPVVLLKVGLKSLVFACACGMKGCNRKLRYSLKAEGHHPMKYSR